MLYKIIKIGNESCSFNNKKYENAIYEKHKHKE